MQIIIEKQPALLVVTASIWVQPPTRQTVWSSAMLDGMTQYPLTLQRAFSAPAKIATSVAPHKTGGEIFTDEVNNHLVKTDTLFDGPKISKS